MSCYDPALSVALRKATLLGKGIEGKALVSLCGINVCVTSLEEGWSTATVVQRRQRFG